MDYKFFDTHAHLNLSAFKEDVDVAAEKCAKEDVAVINVGTTEKSSKRAVELAQKHDNLYAIIGLHPIHTVPGNHDEDEIGEGGKPFVSKGEIFDKEYYRELAKGEKVVGVGECGFDYWHCPSESHETQEQAFVAQVELANELNLPLMIHTRGPKPGEKVRPGAVFTLTFMKCLSSMLRCRSMYISMSVPMKKRCAFSSSEAPFLSPVSSLSPRTTKRLLKTRHLTAYMPRRIVRLLLPCLIVEKDVSRGW